MPAPGGAISGDLGVVSLFDVGQLLMLNRASGRLSVENDGRLGYLYFDQGQVVNAVDEDYQEGEAAAYRLFTWSAGRFDFTPERPSGTRLIAESTEALMLEAARRLDEAEPGEGATQRLLEHSGSMEQLRETFRALAREAHGSVERARVASGTPLDALTDPDDRLIFRADRPPRLCCGGQWFSASETAMSLDEYAELRHTLFENATPMSHTTAADTPTAAVETRRAVAGDGRAFAVTVIGLGAHEAMWVRRVALDAPDPTKLSGPMDALQQLLDEPHAVVVVAAPSASEATRLLHAVIGYALRMRPESTLVVAAPATHVHDDAAGAVAEVAPADAAAALSGLRPSLVGIEPGVSLPADGWAALGLARATLHAFVAADAAEALDRFASAASVAGSPSAATAYVFGAGAVSEEVAFSAGRAPFAASGATAPRTAERATPRRG